MIEKRKRPWSRRFFLCGTLVLTGWMQACSKKPIYPYETAATPVPDAAASADATASSTEPPPGPLQPVDEEVLAQERKYHDPRTTKEQREAILGMIGRLASRHSVPALRRIFDEEKRADLLTTIVDVIADREDAASVGQRYDLLSHATEARQPPPVRLAAMAALEDIEDARVPALIRALTRDPNPMVREDAGRILLELDELRAKGK